jgi:hypothetical protein
VPSRYLLQLQLPFSRDDTADSVKFSSKKQPATLRVQLRILSPGQPAAAAAADNDDDLSLSSGTARKGRKAKGSKSAKHPQQQQGANADAAATSSSSRNHSNTSSSGGGVLVKTAHWLDAQGLTYITPILTGQPVDERQQRRPLTWIGLLLLQLCWVVQLLVFVAGLLVIGVSMQSVSNISGHEKDSKPNLEQTEARSFMLYVTLPYAFLAVCWAAGRQADRERLMPSLGP